MRIDALHEKLELFKASAYEHRWTLYDPDGNPINLVGMTATFRAWASKSETTPLIEVSALTDDLGNVDLGLSSLNMDVDATGENPYPWNVILNDGSDDYVIAEGPLVVHDKARTA